MCGIAGFVHFDTSRPATTQLLNEMRDRVFHRGPDSAGSWIVKNVALGHRRLAIIDTSNAGAQPMLSKNERYVLVFNGEIYNYIELRTELTRHGHQFHTDSDTEVLLAAFEQWGHDCVQHFNGVWAFAVYDRQREELVCSRDRLGEKPLYFAVYDNSFVFGSEIKSLLAYGIPADFNPDMLDSYLCYSYVPAPFSFFKHIQKLQPGHSLIVRNAQVQQKEYWNVPLLHEHEQRADEPAILRDFEDLFYDAVRLRMRSDVPFGAFLSGGLDSASIVCAMSEISSTPIQTFTAGFTEKAYDERDLAALVAKQCKTHHRSFEVEMQSAEALHHTLATVYDEPFGDSSSIPSYLIAAQASKEVRVILTGDGGDEVLNGYTIHQGERFAQYYNSSPQLLRNNIVPTALSGISRIAPASIRRRVRRVQDVLHSSALDFESRLLAKQNGFREVEREAIATQRSTVSARDILHESLRRVETFDSFTKLNYWLTKVALPDDMLTKVDRATMAHALEARLPFLDHRLVELMWTVRSDIRMKGFERKYILKKVMGPKLPPQLLRASKKGFVVPLLTWLAPQRQSGLRTELETMRNPLIRQEGLQEVLLAQDKHTRDAANALWSVAELNAVAQKLGHSSGLHSERNPTFSPEEIHSPENLAYKHHRSYQEISS